jgi:hypothetical protein
MVDGDSIGPDPEGRRRIAGSGTPGGGDGVEGDREPNRAGWRGRRWWSLGAGAVVAAAIVAGVLVGGHLGPTQGPTAATSSPAKATSTPTTGASGLYTSPTAAGATNEPTPTLATTPTPTPTPTPTTTPSPGTPTLSPIATPPALGIAFDQGHSTENCDGNYYNVYPETCETVPLAESDVPSSIVSIEDYDTAQVSFADASVQMPLPADGTSDVVIVGVGVVVAGRIIFPAAGTYPYTVTITDTQDGASASWTGSIPVGLLTSPTPTPSPSPSATPS